MDIALKSVIDGIADDESNYNENRLIPWKTRGQHIPISISYCGWKCHKRHCAAGPCFKFRVGGARHPAPADQTAHELRPHA